MGREPQSSQVGERNSFEEDEGIQRRADEPKELHA